MKTLKELFEVYRPKAKGEQDFVDKHVVIKHKDRNGNGDDVFNGKTKPIDRKKERHGYDAGDDEKVYEEVEDLDEAISISHDRYLRSHGKKASGSGAWIFTNKKNGNIDLDDHKKSHIGKGKFSDASKAAKKWAKEHGHTTVYVAEDFNEDVVRNSILEMAEIEGVDLTEEQIDDLVFSLIEEVEELDELSKDTLKSYLKKSVHSSAAAWRDDDGNVLNRLTKGASKTISKRYKGQNSAERKLAKEEVEELDEGLGTWSHEKLKSFINVPHGRYSPKEISDEVKRRKKLQQFNSNYQTEEVEDLDEAKDQREYGYEGDMVKSQISTIMRNAQELYSILKDDTDLPEWVQSKITLACDYVQTASDYMQSEMSEAVKNPYAVGMAAAEKSTGDTPPLKKSTIVKGHKIAKKVMTKEDVINNAIAKYASVDEGSLPTREERLISKLGDLSETHVNTLLTVFDGLNEDNQMKMLAAADTHEGVRSLLDFAIQSKGV